MGCSFGATWTFGSCSANRPGRARDAVRRPLGPCSALRAEAAGRPGPLSRLPHPPQPLDQHGVVREGLGPVDEGVEHLVVAGARHVEQLADGLFLRPGARPAPRGWSTTPVACTDRV